ncbi:MAG: MFS transporter [Alphaproteobacteria bacterium]|nr:MFS transporter [Alphaproteobacteria bacterium]
MIAIDDRHAKWWILAAMGGVIGLILLDETVVGVALPTMRGDLGMSLVVAHWVVNSYLLVFACFAALAGKFGDIIGLKILFLIGAATFGLASLVSGFAGSGAWLVAARSVQGLGAAVIFPASMAMITIVFRPEERGMALGIYGAIGTVFMSLGPFVGGLLTDTLSWRWIFWVNLPIVIVVMLVVLAAWKNPPREEKATTIDRGGLVTLVGGLTMLVFGIMQGPEWGWSQPLILALLAGGALLLFVFVIHERRAKSPLIEVDLFRNGTFTACNFGVFSGQFSKMGVIIFGALYLQEVLDMDPLVAGLALVVSVIPNPFLAPVAGKLADKFGSRILLLAAMAVSTVALMWLGIAVAWNDYAPLVPGLVIWGGTMAFLFVPSQRAVMNAVPNAKQGQAGGINLTAQLMGGTIGMAVCSTVFAMTGDFGAVFFATALVMLASLVTTWRAVERTQPTP